MKEHGTHKDLISQVNAGIIPKPEPQRSVKPRGRR